MTMSRDVKYMDTVGKLLDIVYGHWVLFLISILGSMYKEHWHGRPQFSLYPLSISSTEQTTLLYVHSCFVGILYLLRGRQALHLQEVPTS